MALYRNVHKDELVKHLASSLGQEKGLVSSLVNEYLSTKPKKTRRVPPDHLRCMGRVWRGGDATQCMSKKTCGEFCSRHSKTTTTPCKHCSKGGVVTIHEFAWQHHGRFDDLVVPQHFLSVQSKKAIPLDKPFICECGQEIAFQRNNCPSCDIAIVV